MAFAGGRRTGYALDFREGASVLGKTRASAPGNALGGGLAPAGCDLIEGGRPLRGCLIRGNGASPWSIRSSSKPKALRSTTSDPGRLLNGNDDDVDMGEGSLDEASGGMDVRPLSKCRYVMPPLA